jgi:hypothetical protein
MIVKFKRLYIEVMEGAVQLDERRGEFHGETIEDSEVT